MGLAGLDWAGMGWAWLGWAGLGSPLALNLDWLGWTGMSCGGVGLAGLGVGWGLVVVWQADWLAGFVSDQITVYAEFGNRCMLGCLGCSELRWAGLG